MELEFDNEIDALLRKARDDRGVLVGDTAKLHLDADEISAFAENAVPDSTMQTYVTHFAGCDGCRKTLSSLILLNSEAGIETSSAVSAPVADEKVVSWYRKLFLFPNLAYVMGSLVLLFSGFIAISVLKNSSEKAGSDVSQISADEPAASGPNLGFGDSYSTANATNSMASSANTYANTMMANASMMANATNTRNPVFAANTAPGNTDSKQSALSATTDGIITGGDARAGAPPPSPKDQPVTMADKNDLAKTDEKQKIVVRESEKQLQELKMRETLPPAKSGPSKLMKVPSRNERDETMMRENDGRAKKSAKPNASMISNRKQVGGKAFELNQGVWYDSTYRGQSTVNVRRGTDSFRKLDSGLRAIAEGISGTVVTLWKEKAYRID